MNRLCVDATFLILGALCVIILPFQWILGAFWAAFFHECCHLASIYLLGGCVNRIYIGPSGAVIEVSMMTKVGELFCTVAGPAGSFFLLLFRGWFPELATCGLFQGAFNLLPIYPLDGGRILTCILYLICPKIAERWTSRIGFFLSVCLAVFSVACKFWPAVILFIALIRAGMRKIPCKEGNLAVQ